MAVPATSGQERTNLADMQIGDYIACEYTVTTSGAVGTFANLGNATKEEIPTSGSATPDGKFYFIKVDKGLLVADRVIQHSISWDTLNAGNFIEGKVYTFDTLNCLIRSLTGGVAYKDANGNKSTINQGYGGWPINNEWDRYIVKSNLNGTITPGDDNVWHWGGVYCLVRETPYISLGTSTNRVRRGSLSVEHIIPAILSSASGGNYGFRPVLEYKEDGSSLWY